MAKDKGWAELDTEDGTEIEVDLNNGDEHIEDSDSGTESKAQENQEDNKKNTAEEDGKHESRAQKRIRQLLEQNKQLREEAQRATQAATVAQSQLTATSDRTVATFEKQVNDRLIELRNSLKTAINNGDVDAQVEINEKLAELKVEQKQIAAAKAQIERRPKPQAKQVEQTQQNYEYPDKALEWVKTNRAWWEKDPVKTAYAYRIEQKLRGEGFDPEEDDFYSELDKRLAKEFPDEGDEEEVKKPKPKASSSQTQQMVAGGSRPPTTKVRFTQKEFEDAQNKWGFKDPKEYAKFKANAQKAQESGGYTTLEI